jgi:hypothetical protein
MEYKYIRVKLAEGDDGASHRFPNRGIENDVGRKLQIATKRAIALRQKGFWHCRFVLT